MNKATSIIGIKIVAQSAAVGRALYYKSLKYYLTVTDFNIADTSSEFDFKLSDTTNHSP